MCVPLVLPLATGAPRASAEPPIRAASSPISREAHPDNFNVDSLTRTDSLYFTVTVFATVGFGDITATSQTARVVVIAQMLLDLLVLGLVVKVFLGAVEIGRGLSTTRQDPESS